MEKFKKFFNKTETRLRITTATLLIFFVYGVFKLFGEIGISSLIIASSGFMIYEYNKMFNKKLGFKFFWDLLSIVSLLILFYINKYNTFTQNYVFILGFVILFCISILGNITFDKKNIILESLPPVYIGLSILSVLYIYIYTSNVFSLIYMFIITISTDTGGYFIGCSLKGPKLWPSVSPSKTWSGAIGGVLCAFVFSTTYAIITMWASNPNTIYLLAFLSIIMSIAGILGDLFESKIKRITGIKDSSKLIPGHGGFLDRFDSILFVAPIMAIVIAWLAIL